MEIEKKEMDLRTPRSPDRRDKNQFPKTT